MPAYQMLKISKEEFDRLMETSPSINGKIIKKFNTTFSGGKLKKDGIITEKQQIFKDLYKPEICDNLESTKNFVYKESEEEIEKKKTKKIVNFAKENNEFKRKSMAVNKFIDNFNNEYKREPTFDEIYDNMRDSIDDKSINTIITDL